MRSRRSLKSNKQSVEDAQSKPRRDSKVSIIRGNGDHSRTSSRRSHRTQDEANTEESKESTTPETDPPKPQKKGPPKLLALFGCCSSSDDADSAELPAKKSTLRPAASNRLPTPDKAEAQTGDSSTVESREPYLDEKANSTVSVAQPNGEKRNVEPSADGTPAEGPSTAVVQPEAPDQKDIKEKSLPVESEDASPKSNSHENEITPNLDPRTNTATADLTSEPASTAPTSNMPPEPLGADGQKDKAGEDETTQPAKILPPPPPRPTPARGSSEDMTRPLLPAALPHLSGRKCLVLDLDETLVHSSFKVCTHFVNAQDSGARHFIPPLTNCRFWIMPTSLFR